MTRQQKRREAREAAKRADRREFLTAGLALHQAGRLSEAAEHYEHVLDREPRNAEALNLLGVIWHQRGDQQRAIDLLNEALRCRPDAVIYHVNLGSALAAAGNAGWAVRNFRRAVALGPASAMAHRNLGSLVDGGAGRSAAASFGRAASLDAKDAVARLGRAHALKRWDPPAAIASCRAALAIDPSLAEARFLLAALEGEAPTRPPAAYVRGLFDKYATEFDRHLIDKLGYATPALLAEMLRELLPPKRDMDILDLGCGTGLSGLALSAYEGRLTGIDLSPAMLAQARSRGIYAELIEGDIMEALAHQPPGRFDLAMASDVLNYFGDLAGVFAAVGRTLKHRGLFACSTEASAAPGYTLHDGLRYAHHPDYVKEVAAAAGFGPLAQRPAILRRQGAAEVAGELFVFARQEAAPGN
ncbi:MAG: tetratricopeptide repeat protein [Proteobacteria bacterium]|nr:tetratricopeptide repeat protein [Pseudomonadota bacterium]MBI3496857.1 tetratricopeptide repeat protein [Pseudomonadota bacterium]